MNITDFINQFKSTTVVFVGQSHETKQQIIDFNELENDSDPISIDFGIKKDINLENDHLAIKVEQMGDKLKAYRNSVPSFQFKPAQFTFILTKTAGKRVEKVFG